MSSVIYTIGHSTHPLERFIALLKKHAIRVVCDVRSYPYSRINHQFNRESLQHVLRTHNIDYIFLGKELGARSDDPAVYVNGKVSYDRLAQTMLFKNGFEQVQVEAKTHCTVLMCAEKDPLTCHRTILISRYLHQKGMQVEHILENGDLESHEESLSRLSQLLHMSETDMFRSHEEIIAEAYEIQGKKISYEPQKVAGQAQRANED